MAEKGPNGQKLIRGSYEPNKKGGLGYKYWVSQRGTSGTYPAEKFCWVKPPPGYSLDGRGGLIKEGTLPEPSRSYENVVTLADMFLQARDESEDRNDRGPRNNNSQG